MKDPAAVHETVRAFLATKGPALLHARVNADELPVLPHVDWATAAKYGLAKFKELFTRAPAAS